MNEINVRLKAGDKEKLAELYHHPGWKVMERLFETKLHNYGQLLLIPRPDEDRIDMQKEAKFIVKWRKFMAEIAKKGDEEESDSEPAVKVARRKRIIKSKE